MKKACLNIDELRASLKHICALSNPSAFNMDVVVFEGDETCGTTACLAGWTTKRFSETHKEQMEREWKAYREEQLAKLRADMKAEMQKDKEARAAGKSQAFARIHQQLDRIKSLIKQILFIADHLEMLVATKVLFCEAKHWKDGIMQPDFVDMLRHYPAGLAPVNLFSVADWSDRHLRGQYLLAGTDQPSGHSSALVVRDAAMGYFEHFIVRWKMTGWPYIEDGVRYTAGVEEVETSEVKRI